MTPTTSKPPKSADADQGLNLVFRPEALADRAVVTLPNSRVGIECPIALYVRGPVILGERSLTLGAKLKLNVDERRYMIFALELDADPDDEINPELLRQIRWGQIFAGALDTLGRVVTFDEDGQPSTHRGVLTLTDEERVGALWLQARLAGLDPNMHIAAQLEISPPAAAARVKRARDNKLIPAATQGQRR